MSLITPTRSFSNTHTYTHTVNISVTLLLYHCWQWWPLAACHCVCISITAHDCLFISVCVCVFPLKVTSSCSAQDKLNQILSCSSTYFWTSVIWSKCTDWLEVVHSYRGRAFWYWKLLKVSLCYPIGKRCMWWSGRELGLPKCNLKTPACHLKTILIFISCISKL